VRLDTHVVKLIAPRRSGVTIASEKMSEQPSAKILVVEDNEADVRLIQEAIRECYPRPVELTSVENGHQALALLNGGAQFDLIVLDLNLPRLDGYEFLKLRPAVAIPVVVFSSSWNEDDSRRAVALGAREFIRKPSSYAEYVEKVCGFIGKWSGPKSQQQGSRSSEQR
jgi:CheY-like chemotaxis protein